MPELPEIEILKRQLTKTVLGQTINDTVVLSGNLRKVIPENFRDDVVHQRINKIERVGKFLLLELENSKTMVIHLGMTGQLLAVPIPEDDNNDILMSGRHTRVVFILSKVALIFSDTRKFGLIDVFTKKPSYITCLGIDPFAEDFSNDYFFKLASGDKRPIKSLLLDQSKISGIGNIYANDALFDACINPLRPSLAVTYEECAKVVKSIKSVLNTSIELGGTSMKDYIHLDGTKGEYQNCFLIYSKYNLPCPRCGQKVLKEKIDGRSSFFCNGCQK